jgi:Zn-dependent protease
MDLARAAKQGKTVSTQVPKTYEHKVTIGRPLQTKGRVYFSPKEVKHLAIAGLLVFGIGFSPILNLNLSSFAILLGTLTIFASILAGSFFAHEMAHKITAQKRGLWAEFRLTLWGAVLTAISVITPFFKIIAPGAVMISGSARNDDMGKVSLAGPVTNIVLSSGLLGLAFVPSGIAWVLFWSSLLNGFMAVFNLIPFGIFDGFKVFSWNKGIWVVAFVASAALTVVSYFFVQSSIG